MTDKPLVISLPEPRTLELIFTPERLRQLRDNYRIIEGKPGEEMAILERHINRADFIIGQPPLPAALVRQATRLKAIFNVEGNFLDNMDYEACFERGIHVLTTSRVFAMPVAEIGLGMALCLLRDICVADRAFRTGNELWGFDGNRTARLLSDSEIGFIGFGDLGQALHGLVKGFGAPVRVFDPWLPDSYLAEFGVEPAPLEEVLTGSDVIFVVASVTTENGGFLGQNEFGSMRHGASLVLLSRSDVVDFPALMEAVQSGHIRVASDVFPEEPMPRDHPVRRLKNFILSAHRAGALKSVFTKMGDMVFEDMDLMRRGLPPLLCKRAERETVGRLRSRPVDKN